MKSIRKFILHNRVALILSGLFLSLFVVNMAVGGDAVFNALSGSGFHKLNGQLYRIVTASFLHAGWLHLTANIVALVCVGALMEHKLGHLRFLAIFLGADVLASLLFYGYFNECSNGNGSSVAIYALFAVLLVLWLRWPSAFSGGWAYPVLGYIVVYFVVASFLSGSYTTIILHSFSFFVGLAIGLIGLRTGWTGIRNDHDTSTEIWEG